MPALTFPADDQTTSLVAAVELPDGEVQVALTGFEATEGVSQLYAYELKFSLPEVVDVTDLVGASVSVGLRARISSGTPPQTRYFHGVINRFSYLGEVDAPETVDGTKSVYKAEVVPPFWFLTHSSGCRIFQWKPIPDIVGEILGEHNIDWNDKLTGKYRKQRYRVQYRESDFAFISRLLEEAGIFYYFKHSDSETKLILSDQLSGWFECDEPVMSYGGSNAHVNSWQHEYQYLPQDYVHRDFNFEEPAKAVAAAIGSLRKFPRAPRGRFFDSVGGFLEDAVGEVIARLRMEELEATSELIQGSSASPCPVPGATFTLSGHPHASENDVERCFRSVTYSVKGATSSLQGAFAFTCNFTCFPTENQFRPPRVTPRPTMPGPQTATVTGDDGDTIKTDKYGRVKVRFHWDETDTSDSNSSCWLRVSQGWAGEKYGSMLLPHVGQEVIVSFLEGDPDRPVVTGRVYNSDNMPPESLPGKKKRAIVAKDDVGNYIALDAEEERVDINNAADKFEYTVGMSASATLGLDFAITVGAGVAINAGATVGLALASSFDVAAGWSTSIAFGGTWGASFGTDFTYAKGRYVNAGDSLGQIAFKEAADVVSQKSVSLAGGSGVNNSVVSCDSDSLTLSFGVADAAFKDVSGTKMALGMLGTSLLGTIGVGAGATSAVLAGSAAEADDAKGLAVGSGTSGAAGVIAAVAATVFTALFAKKWLPMSQPVHSVPKSSLVLDATKAALWADASASEGASVQGNKVSINGATGIDLHGQKVVVNPSLHVLGGIQGVNIQDLGNPAADAASASVAQAAHAAVMAQVQASGAARRAEQAAVVTAAEAEAPPTS